MDEITAAQKEERRKVLDNTKIALMSSPNSAFIATVCFSLKFAWDESIPTACTDGKAITFNTKFFMGLDPQERLFLLMHEAWHVCFMHMSRMKEKQHKKWNIACDHVINLMLKERKFKMPSMGLADPKYSGMSSEQVYALLTDPECESTPCDMDLKEPPEMSEDVLKELEDIIIRASLQSKASGDKEGTIPGEIQIFLNGLLAPKLPWHRILQRYLQAKVKSDYTYRKPNRRFFPAHHLPSLYSEGLMEIAIAVDASGSVSDGEFKQFVSEVNSILVRMKPEKITLIQFDTEIISVHPVKNAKALMQVPFKGRGGTAIGPLFDWAADHKPTLLLIFTDGCFRFPTNATTKTDMLWVVHGNPGFTAPVGKVIHYAM